MASILLRLGIYLTFLAALPRARGCPEKCTCQRVPRTSVVTCTRAGYAAIPPNVSEDVTMLMLLSNQIWRLTPKMFARYRLLEQISLADNKIENVHPNAFDGLTSLTKLDLSGNRIRYFPWSAMDSMPSLSFLVLNNNLISNVPDEGVVEKLKTLGSLRIHGNRLRCSCHFLQFARWIQENERNSKVGAKFVTVVKPEQINCTSLLRWIAIPVRSAQTSHLRERDGRSECPLPIIKMNVATEGQESIFKVDSVKAGVTYFLEGLLSDRAPSDKEGNPEGSVDTSFRVAGNDTGLAYNRGDPPGKPASLYSRRKAYVNVTEGSTVTVTCNVTNVKEMPGDWEVRVRTVLLPKVLGKEIDIEDVTEWRKGDNVIISDVTMESHGSRVVCAAENIAGTATSELELSVVTPDGDLRTGQSHRWTTKSPLRTSKYRKDDFGGDRTVDSRNGERFGENDTQMATTTFTDHNETKLKSLCTEDYNYAIFHLPATSHNGRVLYRYNYGDLINVTMESDAVQGIVVKIGANRSALGTVFICHSHGGSKLKRWSFVKKGVETHFIRTASAVKPFIVCVMSSYFQREVCGNFTITRRLGKSMAVMAFVGGVLLSLGTVPMIVAALHNLYTSKMTQPQVLNRRRLQSTRERVWAHGERCQERMSGRMSPGRNEDKSETSALLDSCKTNENQDEERRSADSSESDRMSLLPSSQKSLERPVERPCTLPSGYTSSVTQWLETIDVERASTGGIEFEATNNVA